MLVPKYNRAIAVGIKGVKGEKGKKQVDIAQIAEINKVIRKIILKKTKGAIDYYRVIHSL